MFYSSKLSDKTKRIFIGLPYLWLVLFFLLPLLVILRISFSKSIFGQPPYTKIFTWDKGVLNFDFYIGNYLKLEPFLQSIANSLMVGFSSAIVTLFLAYPLALSIAKSPRRWRSFLLLLVILPFWTSYLVRVVAWISVMELDWVKSFLGEWRYTFKGVLVGVVYSYFPFMVLPLYANLERHDPTLLKAASDLGASPFKQFISITLPLSLPGVFAGFLLVFIPAVGEYVIPQLIGGSEFRTIGLEIDDFKQRWPMAGTLTVILLGILFLPVALFMKLQNRRSF